MYNDKKISVILPTYNEKDSIYQCIEDFYATGVVDEVLVINNNAAAGTSAEISKTRAKEILETKQGYGHAIQRGLTESSGDLMIVCEPDGTFKANDIFKLLAYASDCEIVYGTRTVSTFIWSGANMGKFLRHGNWFVAKIIEVLFNTISLSDVGCTMRLVSRSGLNKIKPYFTVGGNYFGPEMILLSIAHDLKIIQIPVNYLERIGKSSVTGSLAKAFVLGIRMIMLIIDFRIKSIFSKSKRYGYKSKNFH
ncbi:MAG: glycosyltransferase family 2 protein [Candidatus Margulisbacteria bacterium]|nr:glycosyltransferase family 2 protein [Candidatus Margulisiibacteriota bacterium]